MKVSLDEPQIHPRHVIVTFGKQISSDVQGRALLHLERYMREELGVPAEVYKVEKEDDLKRRRDMTEEDRLRL